MQNIRPSRKSSPLRRIGMLLALAAVIGSAQAQAVFTPYDVEAAYLYNFGKFVRWPADPAAASVPFTICILGDDPFGGKLDSLVANETIQGRPIAVKRLSSTSGADNCQIVFLGLSEQARLTKDLADLNKKPALTVSNLPGFLEHGGMIQFLQQQNKVRFAVNLTSAEQPGLALSSELLKVAVHVESKAALEVKP
jgi:YfiR/HmsC-like